MSVPFVPFGGTLHQYLKEEDFPLPPDVRNIDLRGRQDGMIEIYYTVLVRGENLEKLGRAIQKMSKEWK